MKEVIARTLTAVGAVGAICAAPAVVLSSHGFLRDRRATCHPNLAADMVEGTLTDERVTVDGNLITSPVGKTVAASRRRIGTRIATPRSPGRRRTGGRNRSRPCAPCRVRVRDG